ncbi:ZW10 interactor [Pseudophryne corroboree]|uniref:ZW10 interactor n=1 Tax=Pseudophryne corroboree TaxID=495146 RepID=UPI0030817EF8
MAETAERLLDSLSNISWLDVRQKADGDAEVPAKVLVDYSVERSKKQKMLCGQLQVLRFMLEFLRDADSVSWEDTIPELLSREVEEVKEKWKALKCEYQEKVTDVVDVLPQLLDRIQLLQEKRRQLEQSLQRYQSQKEVAEMKAKEKLQHLQEVVEKQRLVVEKCQGQILELKEELQRLEQSADSWIQAVSRDSTHLGLLRSLSGVSLVSIGGKELVLDVSADEKTEIPPLRVTLHGTAEGKFQVETDSSVPSLPADLQHVSSSHITPVILELQSWYRSNTRLLKELGELQQRFALDWIPAEQMLIVLKGGKQFRLLIEPGYPLSGSIRLVSVTGAEPYTVPENFKPPVESPSLSEWLEYLHDSPHFTS